jgi:lipoprotein-anchoring transpeptidase ErfK/SrfK
MRVGLALVCAAALGGVVVLGLTSGPGRSASEPLEVFSVAAPPGEGRLAAPAAPAVVAAPPARACRAGELVAMRDAATAHAAVAKGTLAAVARPGGSVLAQFSPINVNGVPTVFGVLSARLDATCTPVWYRVQLPLRPNGRTGWVRARDVALETVDTRIVVDLSERRVRLFKAGQPLLEAVAAIGKPGTPTPTGSFYVNQRLLAEDPAGPYGPGGIGISAFSPTLQNWVQGGPIAIHGTNVPHLLGEAVSHGCVRVENAELRRLMELVPEGTPVVIRS